MIAPGSRPLHVKFILPALKEATDPQWRPIKYSLFPPLGLATLAAYLSSDDHAMIVDEHVEPLTLDDTPELVVVQVYITNAYRAYRIADHYRRLQRLLRENLVKAQWETSATNRRVRTYRITPSGIKHLEREVNSFEQMLMGIRLVLASSES